jgi:hypothetical protein
MRKLALPICLGALLFSCLAQAQVYKWVDAKGVTHYDEKPPENMKSKEVTLRNASPSGAVAPANTADPAWKEKERAFKQRQVERNEAEAKKTRDQARLDTECQKTRANLSDMRAANRVYARNDKGEREFLSDKDRESAIAARQEEYNQNCR